MAMTATIQRVHNPTTHRLDAGSVAELYGLKLAPLARMLRLNAESLQRRPDSPVAQEPLRRLVHTWDTLAEIFADEATVRNWLYHPNRALHGAFPISLLERENGLDEMEIFVEEVVSGNYS